MDKYKHNHISNLKQCQFGKNYEIVGLVATAPLKIRRRLCDLGFNAGQKIRLVRKSLLGKAYLVELRGYTLSIRGSVAEAVIVK